MEILVRNKIAEWKLVGKKKKKKKIDKGIYKYFYYFVNSHQRKS